MFVLIVGSGRLGVGLAKSMSSRKDDVVIVAENLDSNSLGEDFDGIAIDGDPMDLHTLELAGARKAALFIAVAADDNVNIFCAQAAKKIFGVKESLARIADPEKEAFYRGLSLETVCPTVTGINQVLEHITEERSDDLGASLDPSYLCVKAPDKWLGMPCSSVSAPGAMRIVGLVKDGHIAKAKRHDVVRRGDTIVLARGSENGGRLWIV
jgi:trk system potassium uptake protein TrkA